MTWKITKSNYRKIKKISDSYANTILALLKKSLNRAVTREFLDRNVMDKVKRFKQDPKEAEIWTLEQFQKVLDQIYIQDYKQNFHYCLLLTLFMTGCRIGELQALYWENINFTKGRIDIFYTLDYKNRQEWSREFKTKTKSGKRTIALDSETLKVLRRWQRRQSKHCQSNFVFSLDGNPLTVATVNNLLKRYANLANVPPIKVHGLRHSHASYLLEQGISIASVSKNLGHSSINITLGVYAHAYKNADEKIAEELTGIINQKGSIENKVKTSSWKCNLE